MIEHLSYSSISTYLSCPAYWRRRYLDKMPTATSIALVFGSAWHNTVEDYLTRRVMGNDALDLAAIWDEHWKLQLESYSNIDWGLDTPEQHYNEGLRLLLDKETLKALDEIRPKVLETGMPVIEKRIEVILPGVGVPIIGYIDVITDDGVPGDFKTSSKSWTADRALDEMQPVFYLAALNQLGELEDYRFRHYVIVKNKTPKFQVIETVRRAGELFFLMQMVRSVWNGIQAEAFFENPTTWKCNPRYCEYWNDCRGRY